MKKKIIALLLAVLMLSTLCGGPVWADDAEDASVAYVAKDKELLVRMTECGDGSPSFIWPVLGRCLDRVTEYMYDEFGNVTSEVSYLENPAMSGFLWYLENNEDAGEVPAGTESLDLWTRNTINGYDIMKQFDFEDGLLVHERTFLRDDDSTIDETTYSFYENGQLKSADTVTYLDSLFFWELDGPGEELYEYNEEGYCTHWHHVEEDGMGEADVTYEYCEKGNLTFLSLRVNDGEPQTMIPVYENDRQVATFHTAPDGGKVEQRFGYDDDGRLVTIEYDAAEPHAREYLFTVDGAAFEMRYNEYKAGDRHVVTTLSYNDDGYVSGAVTTVDGSTVAQQTYRYETDEYGVEGSVENLTESCPWLWGGAYQGDVAHKAWTTREGNPETEYTYTLKVLGSNVRYTESETEYEYETRSISVPVGGTAAGQPQQDGLSPEDFFPDLRESYLGTAVPTPDGSRKLVRVVLETDATELPVVAEMAYLPDGSFAGVVTEFDGIGEFDDWQWDAEIQTDEQGRLISDRDTDRWGNTTYTYEYAEDGQSYVYGREWGDGESYERIINLADLQIQDLVKKPAGELSRGETEEYNDEGLPIRIGMYYTKDSEGNLVEEVRELSYHWENGVWASGMGAFPHVEGATVLKQSYQSPYGDTIDVDFLVFDSQGYLISYYPLGPFEMGFHYYYE